MIDPPTSESYPSAVPHRPTCCICSAESPRDPETACVRSNVRAFKHETFTVWRCRTCQSIHAADDVDLDRYYGRYPFFQQTLNAGVRNIYRRLVGRLNRAGLTRDKSIVDYGCGSGLLVTYLNQRGYHAVGYDPYSQTHGDPATLEAQYDFVIAQDVVEHAADPLAAIVTLDDLAAPGGAIIIGTPNAAGIDLSDPETFVHPLHQPYHRHLFSIDALKSAAAHVGWSLQKYYPTPYTNRPVLSLPFLHHYMQQFDGCIDTLFDAPMASAKLWLNPKTYWKLIAGYWQCDDADIVAVFRKG